jgi:hypothetical protein
MLHASMDMDIYNISVHGWANNEYMTTSCLPSAFHHAVPAQVPVSGRLPDGLHTPEDDIQRLCLREFLTLASPRETNSYHP